jgi:hypothetical protein
MQVATSGQAPHLQAFTSRPPNAEVCAATVPLGAAQSAPNSNGRSCTSHTYVHVMPESQRHVCQMCTCLISPCTPHMLRDSVLATQCMMPCLLGGACCSCCGTKRAWTQSCREPLLPLRHNCPLILHVQTFLLSAKSHPTQKQSTCALLALSVCMLALCVFVCACCSPVLPTPVGPGPDAAG